MRLLPIVLLLATAAAQTPAPPPIGELETKDATVRGSVEVSGATTHIQSGAQVTAGGSSAKIKLTRGGEFDICPGASVTLTASANARENLIALHAGSIETHYPLSTDSDTLLTPDFRIQLPGPGEFHFAIGLGVQGDACVESLPGDTASIIVSEQFGDGTHQVRPGEHLLFRNGTVRDAEGTQQPCGCPVAHPALSTDLHFPAEQSQAAAEAVASGKEVPTPPTPALVPAESGQVHVTVEAPMVFRADEAKLPPSTSAKPETAKNDAPAAPAVTAPAPAPKPAEPPPAPPEKPKKKGFFQRFGAAIARFFGGGKKPATQPAPPPNDRQ